MSRCFPFPPPGYEKTTELGDTDLLTKEKHREKRHKKDKEKSKGKERKKDKGGQPKEKKDRKEKHKHRNDKDRDKLKKNNLVEKDLANGEKLGSKCLQSGAPMDSQFLLELGKRIKDEGRARENQMFQGFIVTYQNSGELPSRVVEINIGNSTGAKETYKNKKDGGRNITGHGNQVKARGVENGFVQGFSVETGFVQGFCRTNQKRVVGVAGPVDKDVKKQREGKKKHRLKDGEGQKGRDEPGYKDRTKEKEEEAKPKEEQPKKEQHISRVSNKDSIDSLNVKLSSCLKDGNKSSTYNINLGKRKELEMNGFSHDDIIWPNKLPRLISSSHQLVENGRQLELCQSALQFACESEAATYNKDKVEGKISSSHQILQNGRKSEPKPTAISNKTDKDARTNGLIEAQQVNACSNKPLSTARAKVKVKEGSVKLPHRDSKYLSEILHVPKVEGWSDFDNQEWLYSNDKLQTKKPNAGPLEVDGTPQVWAQALRIQSMDVTALPYVVPF